MSSFEESSRSFAADDATARLRNDAVVQALHQNGRSLTGGVAAAPRMIIVEDAPLIALDLAETMKELGFDVRATAFTHDQALAEIDEADPDFAVIDLHLGMAGEGRDGEALLAILDARGCRCLVFSGDGDACRRVAARYPRVSVLAKPAEPDLLAREIEGLRQRPAA